MKQRYFTKEQRFILYDWFDKHRHDDCALMLDILATTGCRVDELMRIQFSDINRHDLTITIQRGSKGSESRTRRLSQSLVNALYDAKERHSIGDYDFVSDIIVAKSNDIQTKKKMLRRYFLGLRRHLFKSENLPGLHGFRHSKAFIVYEETKGDVYAVKTCLGHKTISSTEHYLSFVDETKFRDVFAKRG